MNLQKQKWIFLVLPFLRASVLLIPNFPVFCANFSSKLNSSPRLRGATGFSGFSPCLLAVACPEVRRRGGGFSFWFFLCVLCVLCGKWFCLFGCYTIV